MTPLERLSPAERQTAALIYAGWTVRQIASARHSNTGLVAVQLDNIYRKLRISTTQELAEIYRQYHG